MDAKKFPTKKVAIWSGVAVALIVLGYFSFRKNGWLNKEEKTPQEKALADLKVKLAETPPVKTAISDEKIKKIKDIRHGIK